MRILRILAGAVLAYLVSVLASQAWFMHTKHSSILPASNTFMALTAGWCILQGLGSGIIAANAGRSRISSLVLAALVILVSLLAWHASHQPRPVWSLVVATFVLAPATAAVYLLPRRAFIKDLR